MSSVRAQTLHSVTKNNSLLKFPSLHLFLLMAFTETPAKCLPYFLNIDGSPFSTAGDVWSHNCLITKANFNKFSFCYDTYTLVKYITYLYLNGKLTCSITSLLIWLNIIACADSQVLSHFICTRYTKYYKINKHILFI